MGTNISDFSALCGLLPWLHRSCSFPLSVMES